MIMRYINVLLIIIIIIISIIIIIKVRSRERTILAKYVQNVMLINNMLIQRNENIALK